MHRIVQRISALLELIATLSFALVFFGLFLAVMLRYVFSLPIVWSEEIATVAAAWMVFSGAAVAALRADHLNVDMFMRLPIYRGWLRYLHEIFVGVMVVIFGAALCVAGARITVTSWERTLPALGWSYGLFYLASAIGGGMIALAACYRLVFPRLVKPIMPVGAPAGPVAKAE